MGHPVHLLDFSVDYDERECETLFGGGSMEGSGGGSSPMPLVVEEEGKRERALLPDGKI